MFTGRRHLNPSLAVLVFFVVATGVMLFPLSIHLPDHVPDLGDPLEYAWVLAWNARQLLTDPSQIYNANIFYPFLNSLAYSESQFASSVLAIPVYLATDNAILAYNVVFYVAFVFSAFNTYLLAFDLTRHRPAAILAGFAFAFWSYPLNHLSHLNLVTLQYVSLAFFAFRRAFLLGQWKFAIVFCIALSAQVLSSWYSALMLVLALGIYAAYLLAAHYKQIRFKNIIRLLFALIPSLLLIAAAALPYFQVNQTFGLGRSLEQAQIFAALPGTFLTVASRNLIASNWLSNAGADALFPGVVIIILACIGVITRQTMPEKLFWMILVGIFLLIAFGPTVELANDFRVPSLLYRALHQWVPGFQGTRAPSRFFVIGMLGLSLLAALGFKRLVLNRPTTTATLLSIGALSLVGLEFFAPPLDIVPVQVGRDIPAVYRWLAQQPKGNYIEMPLRGDGVEWLTRPMYFSTVHWHSTPLGYASFTPATMLDFLSVMNDDILVSATRIINMLREFDVRYWIFHADEYSEDEWNKTRAALSKLEGLMLEWHDANIFVYRVQGDAPKHPLTIEYLAPHFGRVGEEYIGYLVLQHSRHYPIVNDDLAAHPLAITWYCPNSLPMTYHSLITFPPVLRGRPDGVKWKIVAPNKSGDCEIEVTLDGKSLKALDDNSRVQLVADTNPTNTAPNMGLLTVMSNEQEFEPNDTAVVQIAWRSRERILEPLRVGVTLRDPTDTIVYETTDNPVLSFLYPTHHWLAQELVITEYPISLPAVLRKGRYRLEVELLDSTESRQIPFTGVDGLGHNSMSIEIFELR